MPSDLLALTPRLPWESAASLADSLFGERPSRQRAWMACGTVSWPLQAVAAYGNGYYGDVQTLLKERSLVGYCLIGLPPRLRRALCERAITGAWALRDQAMSHGFLWRPVKICPACAVQSWHDLGIMGWLWPHQAPLVEACWRHGLLLSQRQAQVVPGVLPPARDATPDQVAFARNAVAVCAMGMDIANATPQWVQAFRDAGYLNGRATFRTRLFTQHYREFGIAHFANPTFREVCTSPGAATQIAHFVEAAARGARAGLAINPVYLVAVQGFFQTLEKAAVRRNQAGRLSRIPRWCCWTIEPDVGTWDGGQSALADLVARGCSPREVANRCGISLVAARSRLYREPARYYRKARWRFLRRSARETFLRLAEAHPVATANFLGKQEPNLCKWLAKEDPAWWQRQLHRLEVARAAADARCREARGHIAASGERPQDARARPAKPTDRERRRSSVDSEVAKIRYALVLVRSRRLARRNGETS
ncbi:hypothetical protein [Cupriavidus pampae]|uniref:Transposon Tn7 transposition protein TnsD C-termianl domain-containing protein n=1 Tax=Cupriavidus pampae TaxID=659251 RepID=A0ABM8XSU4_9BURK|nr:hypothetical protein [Cupriavidus pampae]CAG9183400.1 hypothetical protein LMG32289_05368 [Cupriavidus pampae]